MFRLFKFFIELICWFEIVLSPFLIGLTLGAICYFYFSGESGLITGIILSLAGLIVGIIWATRIWKQEGTSHYMSRIMATPELDKKPESEKEE